MASDVARPLWYSHGLNRLGYYRAMGADSRYHLTIEPAIWVKPGEEVAALTGPVGALERTVGRTPTQWFNFFDVWADLRG